MSKDISEEGGEVSLFQIVAELLLLVLIRRLGWNDSQQVGGEDGLWRRRRASVGTVVMGLQC